MGHSKMHMVVAHFKAGRRRAAMRRTLVPDSTTRHSKWPEGETIKRQIILTISLICLLTICCPVAAQVQAENLRAATGSSYIERGNEWFAKGEYARAEADFTLAIATDPSQANAYYNRATTRHRM